MTKTKEMVNSILKLMGERTQKIQDRIKELNQELESVKSSIKVLTNKLVECEISGDSSGQKNLDKKIAELKQRQRAIEDKMEPYQNSLNDTRGTRKYIQEDVRELILKHPNESELYKMAALVYKYNSKSINLKEIIKLFKIQ